MPYAGWDVPATVSYAWQNVDAVKFEVAEAQQQANHCLMLRSCKG